MSKENSWCEGLLCKFYEVMNINNVRCAFGLEVSEGFAPSRKVTQAIATVGAKYTNRAAQPRAIRHQHRDHLFDRDFIPRIAPRLVFVLELHEDYVIAVVENRCRAIGPRCVEGKETGFAVQYVFDAFRSRVRPAVT